MSVVSRPYVNQLARRAAIVLWTALCLALPPACVATSQLDLRARIARASPPPAIPRQGLYEGCAPGPALDTCIAHLTRIRAAGFDYVLNYSSWYASPEEVLRYANAAAMLGLQLIWPLNHQAWRGLDSLSATYPDMTGGRPELSNRDFAALAIALVVNHPATWGFYVGDEVAPTEAASVAALSAVVRRLAPDRPQLYVARPGAALLEPFASFVDLAGIDAYPIGSGDPSVRQAARTARAVAAGAGVAAAMVLQAFSWSQYRPTAAPAGYPTARNLRKMRDAAIRNGEPSLILWYSYQDILRSDRPQQRWCELVWAAFSPVRHELRLRSCA
ncbi:MAG: hypothetical protein WA687_06195 [Solirubrobacterales bacterium]